LWLLKRSRRFHAILHFAGQVAVTTSVVKPFEDFEINAFGTLNLLEAVRLTNRDSIFLFSSTNKVYGALEHIPLVKGSMGYSFKLLKNGISEEQPLDFHSPYGCSKGCADQYVRDYARIYGLRTVIFRQSCVYGPRQFGVEDQGWVAWFMIAREIGKPITIYGDGRQVRDILHIDDLSRCVFQVFKKIDKVNGEIFNIGGGSENSLSVLDLVSRLKREDGSSKWKVAYSDWRSGDQRIYISNIERAKRLLGWKPLISVQKGLGQLRRWVQENRGVLTKFSGEKKG